MTTERYIRMVAGIFVLVSLALGYWVHHGWFFFTAFVGLNLLQSAFTGFCPAEAIFKRLGFKQSGCCSYLRGALCDLGMPFQLRRFAGLRSFICRPADTTAALRSRIFRQFQ